MSGFKDSKLKVTHKLPMNLGVGGGEKKRLLSSLPPVDTVEYSRAKRMIASLFPPYSLTLPFFASVSFLTASWANLRR